MNDLSTITLRMFLEHPLDIPLLQWALFVVVLTFCLICMYLQMKDDRLDLRWLIMERPHKPSLSKIGQIVALLVSTWGFVTLVMKGQLTETYFIFYMATWSGSAAIDQYIRTKNGPSPEQRSTDPVPGPDPGSDIQDERNRQ